MSEFKGQVAVVTGGASGVGRCIVQQLAEGGATVVMADIDDGALAREAGAMRDSGHDVHGIRVDVTQAESVAALAAAVFDKHGTVHLLFNNAGVGVKEAKRPIWTIPERDWRWAYDVNVMGVVHGIHAFVPTMIERGEPGHIINTSSGNGGLTSLPTTPVYASSKAAVTSLTEVLYAQLVRHAPQLRAHLLFPGPHLVNTNILNSDRLRTDAYKAEGDAPATYTDMKVLAASVGLDFKLTEPEEVATMALDGIRNDQFWILSREGISDDKLRARTAGILERRNPG